MNAINNNNGKNKLTIIYGINFYYMCIDKRFSIIFAQNIQQFMKVCLFYMICIHIKV
jgi:hypothetical protein